MKQRGFSALIILLIVAGIIVVGSVWYYESRYLRPRQQTSMGVQALAPQQVNSDASTSQSYSPPGVQASTTQVSIMGSGPTSSTKDWQTCRNELLGYAIQYPPDWEVTTYGGGAQIPATCSDPKAAYSLSISPVDFGGVYLPAIGIGDDGTSTSLNQFFQDNQIEIYSTSTPSSTPITIAGETVPWFDYALQDSGIFVWHNGHVIEIGIDNMPTTTLAAMLRSFEFIP